MEGIGNKQQAIVSSDSVSRQFEEIIVEYPEITDREHKGKPYYSIKYVEGGEKYIGYGTYKIDVLSSYIKDYFIPSAQPEPCEDAISRSEAIKVIEAIPDGNWKSIRYSKEIQRLPSVQPEPCEDAVSRHRLLSGLKELIDAWEKYPVMAEQIKGVETAIGYVKTIPSVTPKGELMTNADKFKQMFGLYATELWSKTEVEFLAWLNSDFSSSEIPNSSDCISRQTAIDATYAETVSTNPEHFKSSKKFIGYMDDIDISDFGRWQWANGFNTALVAIKIKLEKLPSAEPERKKGKWTIKTGKLAIWDVCSECKKMVIHKAPFYNYCPNCGADMRGKQE